MAGRFAEALPRAGMAALLAALVTAGGFSGGWARAEERLVVYSGRGERFTRPIVEAFEASSGIGAVTLVGDSGQLLTRIEEEGERTEGDVFITNYAGILEEARVRGLLRGYRSAVTETVPAKYHGPDNAWMGASVRVRTIVYNKALADPAGLQAMRDLANPVWAGKLGITVSSNASFIGGVAAMINHDGLETTRRFLEGIKSNAGNHIYPTHTPVVSAVARGEVAVGLINHYYFFRAIDGNPDLPIALIFPDQATTGAPETLTGLAILRHAKHPDKAQKFIDFVLSPEGQKVFAEVNYEFPVRPDVPAHPLLPDPARLRLEPVSQTLQVQTIDQAIDLIKKVGLQ